MVFQIWIHGKCRTADRLAPTPSTDMTDISTALDVRKKYSHFRILVIGRANAGKTTLLKRVCNTTEDPCIYDEGNQNLVCLPFKLPEEMVLIDFQPVQSLNQPAM
jgi:GTP-binding protein EngB required for normal cell division